MPQLLRVPGHIEASSSMLWDLSEAVSGSGLQCSPSPHFTFSILQCSVPHLPSEAHPSSRGCVLPASQESIYPSIAPVMLQLKGATGQGGTSPNSSTVARCPVLLSLPAPSLRLLITEPYVQTSVPGQHEMFRASLWCMLFSQPGMLCPTHRPEILPHPQGSAQ